MPMYWMLARTLSYGKICQVCVYYQQKQNALNCHQSHQNRYYIHFTLIRVPSLWNWYSNTAVITTPNRFHSYGRIPFASILRYSYKQTNKYTLRITNNIKRTRDEFKIVPADKTPKQNNSLSFSHCHTYIHAAKMNFSSTDQTKKKISNTRTHHETLTNATISRWNQKVSFFFLLFSLSYFSLATLRS